MGSRVLIRYKKSLCLNKMYLILLKILPKYFRQYHQAMMLTRRLGHSVQPAHIGLALHWL